MTAEKNHLILFEYRNFGIFELELGYSHKGSVMRSFDFLFVLNSNKPLNGLSSGLWFQKP